MFATYERLKAFYAEQLYIWGLLKERLCVLKASSITHNEDFHNSLKMSLNCHNDDEEPAVDVIDIIEESNKTRTGNGCRSSFMPRPTTLYCILCLLPVRGLATCCHKCGHAGHTKHVKKWFENHLNCPVPSCECNCIENQE